MTESTPQNQSVYRFRWVGYGLLVFALIDSILALIPSQFEDPAWRLQTLGKLVETVVVPLIGFALVFFGEAIDRHSFEKVALGFLSWLCLVLTIVFLLLIPMGILGTLQINGQFAQFDPIATEQKLNQQIAPTLAQLKVVEDQLKRSSPEDIKRLGEQAKNLGVTLDTQNPQQAKVNLLSQIQQRREQEQQRIKQQVAMQESELKNKQKELLKNSFKWNLGAFIAAVLFFVLWKSTDWAR